MNKGELTGQKDNDIIVEGRKTKLDTFVQHYNSALQTYGKE